MVLQMSLTSYRTLSMFAMALLTWLSTASASLDTHVDPSLGGMSLKEFQGVFFTSVDNEIGILQDENGNSVKGSQIEDYGRVFDESAVPKDVETLWEHLVNHGWDMAETTLGTNRRDLKKIVNADEASPSTSVYPFLLCVLENSLKSGWQRMALLQEKLGASQAAFTTAFNEEDKSCFIVTTSPEKVARILSDNIHGVPLVDQMKITPSTVNDVTSPEWWPTSIVEPDSSRRLNGNRHGDWQGTLLVGIAPGVANADNKLHVAGKILDDIQNLAEEGSHRQRQLMIQSNGQTSGLRASNGGNTEDDRHGRMMSLSQAFFATSTEGTLGERGRVTRRLSELSRSFWSRSLQNGLESEHQCSNSEY
uniref:Uncharacterized protein n=1 Tax=Odontella aurita TaxID=265563 RepID=A0A7S4JN51_9STRA